MDVLSGYGISADEARKKHQRRLWAAKRERAKMAKATEVEKANAEIAAAPRKVFATAHGLAYSEIRRISFGPKSGKIGEHLRVTHITLPYLSIQQR